MNRKTGIFFSALIVAIGGIIYEMIIGTTASYLLGNGVLHFSLTIGIFLAGMGIGSYLSSYISSKPEQNFILIEILLGLFGGSSVSILFATFAYTELFYLVFTALIGGIGILIGTEIPMFLAILKDRSGKEMRELTAKILSIDYLGALIASIAFPMILLPQFGLLRTSFLVGIINLLVGGLMLVSFSEVVRKKLLTLLLVLSFAVLISGFLKYGMLTDWFNKGLYQDEVIYNEQSTYQSIVVTKFNTDLRLYLDGNIQFSATDEYRYHEPLVHVPISYSDSIPTTILILGGGDGLVARELLKYEEIENITLVDLDPSVTDLAQTFKPLVDININSLNNEKVNVINQDAFNHLQNTPELYDLIIVDLPDPNNESLAKLYSIEFYSLISRHLNTNGLMVTQAISPYYTNKTFWNINTSLGEVFEFTYPYHNQVPSFGDWGFIMASNNELTFMENMSFPEENNLINNEESVTNLFYFDSDLSEPTTGGEISTLFDPKILYSYEQIRLWQ